MHQSARATVGGMGVDSSLEAIALSPDIDDRLKMTIITIMKKKGVTATDLLTCSAERLRAIFPDQAVLMVVLNWRQIEMWKIEKLPTESSHFHSAAKTGNMIAVRDIMTRRDLVTPMCRKYLANHADPNNHKRTPLFDASINGHPGIVRILVDELNADVLHKDSTGSMAIHLAAENGRLHSVMFFIEKRPDLLYAPDRINNSPLNRAATTGQIAVVEYLVSKRAYLENYDETGRTPLLQASCNGHLTVVRFLVQKGADIYAKEFTAENMSIHLAAEAGHLAVVQFFLEIDPNFRKIENKLGKNILTLAKERNHEELVQWLVNPQTLNANDQPTNVHTSLPLPTPRLISEQPIVQVQQAPRLTSMTEQF